jgi:hypothetical protein
VPLAVARADVHFGAARSRDLNRDVTRRAEAVQAEARALPVPRCESGLPQAAKTDDAGAQERRRIEIAEPCRDAVAKVGLRERVFGESAVDGPAREVRLEAEVLIAASTESARAARAVQPSDAHALAGRETGDAVSDSLHARDDLMAGNDPGTAHGQITFRHVQVRAAHAACVNAQQ